MTKVFFAEMLEVLIYKNRCQMVKKLESVNTELRRSIDEQQLPLSVLYFLYGVQKYGCSDRQRRTLIGSSLIRKDIRKKDDVALIVADFKQQIVEAWKK